MITPRDIKDFASKAGVVILALEQTRRHWRVEILNNNGKMERIYNIVFSIALMAALLVWTAYGVLKLMGFTINFQ